MLFKEGYQFGKIFSNGAGKPLLEVIRLKKIPI